jgi:hypothetical protein
VASTRGLSAGSTIIMVKSGYGHRASLGDGGPHRCWSTTTCSGPSTQRCRWRHGATGSGLHPSSSAPPTCGSGTGYHSFMLSLRQGSRADDHRVPPWGGQAQGWRASNTAVTVTLTRRFKRHAVAPAGVHHDVPV